MSDQTYTLTETDKDAIRGAYKLLSEKLPGFRSRRSQQHMVGISSRALGNQGGCAVIEAPTGTGKSMGYLTPGVTLAISQQRKLVVSTATVALQEQLFSRDIPLFLQTTGIQAKVALAKGRNRYACTQKMLELAGGNPSSTQDPLFEELESGSWSRPPKDGELQLVETLTKGLMAGNWDGDLDAPPATIPDELKPQLTIPAAACSGARCPYYSEQCAVKKARDKVRAADVIVSNHDLTLLSLAQGDENNFLAIPSESMYVFDEGHRLAEVAISSGAAELHLPSEMKRLPKFKKLMAAAYRATGETRVDGVLLEKAHQLLDQYIEASSSFGDRLGHEWQPSPDDRDQTFRPPLSRLPAEWVTFAKACNAAAIKLLIWFNEAKLTISDANLAPAAKDKLLRNYGMAIDALESGQQLWSMWAAQDAPANPVAKWLTKATDGGLVLNASEVLPSNILKGRLWGSVGSVLVTSATLSMGGDFAFLAQETGAPEDAEFASLPSPFKLDEQAVVQVPAFTCAPDNQEHPKHIADWMQSSMDWDVATLILFTSRRKMEAVYQLLPDSLRKDVSVQGHVPRNAQIANHIERIQAGKRSVLFGLMSLGEGTDLAGKLLEHVVITQIPFSVPSDPVGATRAEWLERDGGNPFFDIALPSATRTLVQFAGRLIRTEDDTGKITLLDRRAVTKRYGAQIINALPPFRREITR